EYDYDYEQAAGTLTPQHPNTSTPPSVLVLPGERRAPDPAVPHRIVAALHPGSQAAAHFPEALGGGGIGGTVAALVGVRAQVIQLLTAVGGEGVAPAFRADGADRVEEDAVTAILRI